MSPNVHSSQCLRYTAAAGHFNEALPVGNGRLGAMVFGQTHRERLVLNEDSCWAGGPRSRINPAGNGALAQLRALLFAARYAEADALANSRMLATPRTIDSYQPMGELDLRVGWRCAVEHYRRWLDLDGAVAVCEWKEGDVAHRRTVFASTPDQVLAIRHEVESDAPPPMSVSLGREGIIDFNALVDGDLLLTGCASLSASRHDSSRPQNTPAGRGVSIAIRLRTLLDAGSQVAIGGRLQIGGARQVTFLIAMATGARESDPAQACRAVLDAACKKPYEELLARHQADHRKLFRSFQLDFGTPLDDGRPIVDRLAALRAGASDPGLLALVVQHRRYLLMAASRPGSLPSNLQGIWTEQQQGPWNSDYHFNINLQMNYWLAEPTGLGECVEPLIAWIESIVPSGQRTARELYGCRGWTLHHLSDSWGATEPLDGIWGLWPWGGAWLMLHLHERWRYSNDPNVLARVWPLMRGAVCFILDFLVEGPPVSAHAGKLTTCPSHSPENAFVTADGSKAKFTYGATMDFGICRALFAASLQEIDVVGGEAQLRAQIITASQLLPPLAISARTGGIQEWAEDYAEADPGHRHVSPLFDLHPGVGISASRTPALAAAAAVTLRRKAAHQSESSHDQPGWTLNWLACLWARLGDGSQAHAKVVRLLTHCSTPNLMTFAHNQPQVADACGTAAAVCEMLVQQQDGVLRLLPALPADWPDGKVSGLCLHGSVVLDMVWRDSKVIGVRFRAQRKAEVHVAMPEGILLNGVPATNGEVIAMIIEPEKEVELRSNEMVEYLS